MSTDPSRTSDVALYLGPAVVDETLWSCSTVKAKHELKHYPDVGKLLPVTVLERPGIRMMSFLKQPCPSVSEE